MGAVVPPRRVVAPITALWVDEGRPRTASAASPTRRSTPRGSSPTPCAGRASRSAARVAERSAPDGAEEVAAVTGAPLDQIVEHVLDVSDNEAAEVLAHQVGLAVGGRAGSFAGGRRRRRRDAGRARRRLSRRRGSTTAAGCPADNRVRLDTLVAVLQVAASPQHPELRAVVSGLPVAGLHRLAGAPLRRGGRAGRGRGTRQDRHAHRRHRPGGHRHRRARATRWSSR